MPSTVTNESKNANDLTLDDKAQDGGRTWEDMDMSWEDEEGTWEQGGQFSLTNESKNANNLSNEDKN